MSWNYRVMKKGEEYAIHEVFYSEDGAVNGYTESPVFPRAASLEQLSEEMERYAAALNEPVLVYKT